MIKSAEEFSNYANKVVNGITSLYLPEADLLKEPDDIEEGPKIPETELNIEPFLTQFYRMDGDSEVCGHELSPLSFDTDQTCAFSKGHYEGKVEWLQCNICEQWFQERCLLE